MKVLLWKEVGGYTACIKIKGRWCYLGSHGNGLYALFAIAKQEGVKVVRVQGTPKALKHSCNKQLKEKFMYWDGTF